MSSRGDTQFPWNHVSPGSGGSKGGGSLSDGVVGEDPGVSETEVLRFAEDHVVKHADAEDLRGGSQPVGAFAVFARWRRIAGWMVVQENERRRAVQQSRLEAFTRMNDRGGKAPDADRMVADRPVFAV